MFDDSVYKTTYQHSVSFDNTFCRRLGEVWPVNDTGGRMTRFCIQCNRIIGEKCVQCGMEATANSNGHAVTGVDFDCSSCGHHFLQRDGGETGGMCEPCFDAELQEAHEEVAKNRVKVRGSGIGNREIVTLQATRPISVYGERSFKDGFVKS